MGFNRKGIEQDKTGKVMDYKKISTAFVTIIFMFLCSNLNAYKFDFITVTDVVKKVKARFGGIDSYQANFKIVSEKLGKKSNQTGTIKYKAKDKLLLEFRSPYGQKIVSNGKMMWIYIPSMNVVAEQDLKSSSGLLTSSTKTGLRRLFAKYHYRFASKEQPETQSDDTKVYTILLKQKESRSGFRTIKLWISEDYFITRARGETSSGKKVDITFSRIKINNGLQNGIFKFDVPASARVIKNPMISEE
ncbi:MAG: outer membrane lipoprotein carrier protein LolA [bacterium]|nr:outer membrane lipoprotein carrier protein LolA [bacterium]